MANQVFFVGPLERILNLRTVPALEGLTPMELASIAQYVQERFFPKGSLLLDPEVPAEAFYIVEEGRVQINRKGEHGQEIGPHEAVGFLHLLARTQTGLEARAVTDTLTLEFDAEAQLDVCEEHFPILHSYIRYLSGCLVRELGKLPDHSWLGGEREPIQKSSPQLDLVRRIVVLRRSPAFGRCGPDALGELSRHQNEVRFKGGERVWQQGDDAEYFLLIVSGRVECRVKDRSSRLYAGPFTSLGMHEALRGESRWYEATAQEQLLALQIDTDPFLDILEDHFDMAMDFLSVMALRLLELRESSIR